MPSKVNILRFFQRDKHMPPCICHLSEDKTLEEAQSSCLAHTLIHIEYGGYKKQVNHECKYCNFDLVKKQKEVKTYAK